MFIHVTHIYLLPQQFTEHYYEECEGVTGGANGGTDWKRCGTSEEFVVGVGINEEFAGCMGVDWLQMLGSPKGAEAPAASARRESSPEGHSSTDPWRRRWRPGEEGRNPFLAVSDSSAPIAIEVTSRDMTSLIQQDDEMTLLAGSSKGDSETLYMNPYEVKQF